MTWQIAPARIDDSPRLAAILSHWIDTTEWMPRLHSHADDLAFVTGLLATGATLVASWGNRASGFIACQGETLTALCMDAGMRGKGGGKALLDATKALHDRLCLWVFEANEGACRFYLREGFTDDGRTAGNNEEGLPDIRMIWHRRKEKTDG